MKLGTLQDGTRDGTLILASRDGSRFARAGNVAKTLQGALDEWTRVEPGLRALAEKVEAGTVETEALDVSRLHCPLPRAYEWVDGSAYLSHMVLVRRARGAEPPATLRTDPLVYQGGSGVLLAPTAPLELPNAEWGLDFEGEVCVVLGDTPRGVSKEGAAPYVRLLMLANDVTYRALVPPELEKGFGFFCSKPATAFSPFAVTPDELGAAWRDGRVHLRLSSYLNDELMGDPDAGAPMHFSFFDLIAHIAKTRGFTAGTILGSGTVSNEDPARGVSCLAERRMREVLANGAAKTPFLEAGDRVRIEMRAPGGTNVFGSIEQKVVAV
jgi:fumarylacetoacetate (FAA) hydrolase